MTWRDFEYALKEVRPAFGVDEKELSSVIRNGIVNYGPTFESVIAEGKSFVEQARSSDITPLVTFLMTGTQGTGKTSIAASLALESGFPYIKMISPETLVGLHESVKAAKIYNVRDGVEIDWLGVYGCVQITDGSGYFG